MQPPLPYLYHPPIAIPRCHLKRPFPMPSYSEIDAAIAECRRIGRAEARAHLDFLIAARRGAPEIQQAENTWLALAKKLGEAREALASLLVP